MTFTIRSCSGGGYVVSRGETEPRHEAAFDSFSAMTRFLRKELEGRRPRKVEKSEAA